jgi:hypothetical protein
VLGCQRLEHRRLCDPAQPDVGGEQVVLDDAPVFGRIRLDDVVIVEVAHGRAGFGFGAPQVRGTFRRDHMSMKESDTDLLMYVSHSGAQPTQVGTAVRHVG